jgi:hypothetical protein
MDLTEKDLKDIENLLIKDNPNSQQERKKDKINVFKHDFRQNKLMINPQKFSKNKNKIDEVKFPKILPNFPMNTTESNNDYSSKLNISDDLLIESQTKNNNNKNNII